MKETGSQEKVERREFPETFNLEVGQHVVALALDEELGIKTKYGVRDVLRVVVRGQEDKLWSLWWPNKLRRPGLNVPFMLCRPEKSNFVLKLPETEGEMKLLWSTGGFGPDKPAVTDIEKSAAARKEILSRFKS